MSVKVERARMTVALPRSVSLHASVMDPELSKRQAESLSRLRTAALASVFPSRKRARNHQSPPSSRQDEDDNEEDEDDEETSESEDDHEDNGNQRGKIRKITELNEEDKQEEMLEDPMIYPGLYAPSGFDMMSILVSVAMRPNAQLEIGCIDSSTALVLCDPALPDLPIVYCSEPFLTLTGYSEKEVLGRNCRFLQTHDGAKKADHKNDRGLAQLRKEVLTKECRVEVVNYRKSGEKFMNLLTTVPVIMKGKQYVVGFQAAGR